MAGHIAGLGYSQRMDVNGDPLVGAKLYIYSAGTSTPATVYEDYALSIEHSHPIVADAAGIIPMFWVNDGTYRVRLTDSAGNEVFDDDNIVALGPSSGTGGSGSSVDSSAIFTTGDMIWVPVAGTRSGWVRSSGRTIGSSASGATERANADTEELYTYLWNNFSNSLCAVTGGRGASGAADFAANKSIATLDMRDKAPWGLSDMGNTSTGTLGTTPGASGGAAEKTLVQANLPNATLTFSGTSSSDGAHTHSLTIPDGTKNVQSGATSSVAESDTAADNTSSNGAHTHTVSGVTSSINGGVTQTAFNSMPPYRLGTWYVKL